MQITNISIVSKIRGVIFGPHKVGKTSLLKTLPVEQTLFIDAEAGSLSVSDWPGATIRVDSWPDCRNLACILRGGDSTKLASEPYSVHHFEHLKKEIDVEAIKKFNIVFFDSISMASKLALQWCERQPQATSQKTGQRDNFAVYGLLGQEQMRWFMQLQKSDPDTIWLVGGLDKKEDGSWAPQLEGAKAMTEMPGIFDEIISMVAIPGPTPEERNRRVFVCDFLNPNRYPAGDRSGCLDMIEQPDLSYIMDKIRTKKRHNNIEKE